MINININLYAHVHCLGAIIATWTSASEPLCICISYHWKYDHIFYFTWHWYSFIMLKPFLICIHTNLDSKVQEVFGSSAVKSSVRNLGGTFDCLWSIWFVPASLQLRNIGKMRHEPEMEMIIHACISTCLDYTRFLWLLLECCVVRHVPTLEISCSHMSLIGLWSMIRVC